MCTDVPWLDGERSDTFSCGPVIDLSPYTSSFPDRMGVLSVTKFRLYFDKWDPPLHVPLGVISRVKLLREGENYCIEIACKDVRLLKFAFQQGDTARRSFFEKITNYAFPGRDNVFAFENGERFRENGWAVYDAEAELRRQGLTNSWSICTANREYQFCETYPDIFAIPAEVNDWMLEDVADFRSSRRIPVLSWIHPTTHVTITRSSQPKIGILGKSSLDDEKYLSYMRVGPSKLYIMDARPERNAQANRYLLNSGGSENNDNYNKFAEHTFLDIDNIHVMRESLQTLSQFRFPGLKYLYWFQKATVESSGWLSHIERVLVGAYKIVEKVENERSSVLVHCSDGWDRTPQLTSLAMLVLDPYYRTVKGYQVLIEKEWCSFGHQFGKRYGHGEDKPKCGERSPVFVQFVDCTWQIMNMYPDEFQFNERFLITILDNLYSCRFGTFLYDSEKIRIKKSVKQRTQSLWSMVNSNLVNFMGPSSFAARPRRVLNPLYPQRIRLWENYYFRWDPSWRDRHLPSQTERGVEPRP